MVETIETEPEIDLIYVSTQRFGQKPQRGLPMRLTWSELAHTLSMPWPGDRKEIAGGFAIGKYEDGIRRKSNHRGGRVLVIDIDGGGDVDAIAAELGAYAAIVLETFSSTVEAPRARVLILLSGDVDVPTYEQAHAIVRGRLRADLDCAPDDGAKDATRLSYSPVRPPGSTYRFRVTTGRPLDVARMIAAQPPPPPPASRPRVVAPEHTDRYRAAALRKAADAVSFASEGARHETLCREAYTLARLDLSITEISDALLPAAVAAMGDARRREAERTIADAVAARRVA